MTLADILEDAAAVVHAGWCQNGGARNASGNVVPFSAPDAFAFDLRGAIYFITDRPELPQALALTVLRERGYEGSLTDWNDEPGRRQDEVVGVLLAAADHAATLEGATA